MLSFATLLRLEYVHCPTEVQEGASSPLLIYSILHASSWYHPSDQVASFALIYAVHLSHLVSNMTDLSDTYASRPGQPRALVGRGAYEEIQGMLLAIQTFKFHYRNIGAWIAITCRLLLNSYGKVSPEVVTDADWRKLWRWLQVTIVSNASYLTTDENSVQHSEAKRAFALLRPLVVHEQPPSPPFLSQEIQGESRPYEHRMRINVLHMARFTGRGLLGPIEQFWSFGATDHDHVVVEPLSEEDVAVKQRWRADLEEWRETHTYPGKDSGRGHVR